MTPVATELRLVEVAWRWNRAQEEVDRERARFRDLVQSLLRALPYGMTAIIARQIGVPKSTLSLLRGGRMTVYLAPEKAVALANAIEGFLDA